MISVVPECLHTGRWDRWPTPDGRMCPWPHLFSENRPAGSSSSVLFMRHLEDLQFIQSQHNPQEMLTLKYKKRATFCFKCRIISEKLSFTQFEFLFVLLLESLLTTYVCLTSVQGPPRTWVRCSVGRKKRIRMQLRKKRSDRRR